LSANEQLELVHKRLVKVRLLPPRSYPDVLLGPVRVFETGLRTSYEPRSAYLGKGCLVLVPDVKLDSAANEAKFMNSINGWQRFAPNLVPWHGLGNHVTVLKKPYVNALADWLSNKIFLELGHVEKH